MKKEQTIVGTVNTPAKPVFPPPKIAQVNKKLNK